MCCSVKMVTDLYLSLSGCGYGVVVRPWLKFFKAKVAMPGPLLGGPVLSPAPGPPDSDQQHPGGLGAVYPKRVTVNLAYQRGRFGGPRSPCCLRTGGGTEKEGGEEEGEGCRQ